MPSPAWENLDQFFSLDDFAVTFVVTPQAGGPARTLKGIFDEPYMNAELGDYERDTARPRFTCKASDLVGLGRGDTVTYDGRTFRVATGPQGDGTGVAVLMLDPA